MSNLLFNEPPLVVSPSLAVAIGLNEAIVLQQMHYWLQSSKHEHEGYKWIYNSYRQWREQFPFWSEDTIARTIRGMETKGYIKSGNFNKMKVDKTKWYRIDYDALGKLESCATMTATCGDEDRNLPSPTGQNAATVPETTTETTTREGETPPADYLPDIVGRIQQGQNGKSGLAIPDDDDEQWFNHRDVALAIFEKAGGQFAGTAEARETMRGAILALAGERDFDPAKWHNSVETCILGGVRGSNVQCMIDTYHAGGDYQVMRQSKFTKPGQPEKPNIIIEDGKRVRVIK